MSVPSVTIGEDSYRHRRPHFQAEQCDVDRSDMPEHQWRQLSIAKMAPTAAAWVTIWHVRRLQHNDSCRSRRFDAGVGLLDGAPQYAPRAVGNDTRSPIQPPCSVERKTTRSSSCSTPSSSPSSSQSTSLTSTRTPGRLCACVRRSERGGARGQARTRCCHAGSGLATRRAAVAEGSRAGHAASTLSPACFLTNPVHRRRPQQP